MGQESAPAMFNSSAQQNIPDNGGILFSAKTTKVFLKLVFRKSHWSAPRRRALIGRRAEWECAPARMGVGMGQRVLSCCERAYSSAKLLESSSIKRFRTRQ